MSGSGSNKGQIAICPDKVYWVVIRARICALTNGLECRGHRWGQEDQGSSSGITGPVSGGLLDASPPREQSCAAQVMPSFQGCRLGGRIERVFVFVKRRGEQQRNTLALALSIPVDLAGLDDPVQLSCESLRFLQPHTLEGAEVGVPELGK
jgi:hypothetical protein